MKFFEMVDDYMDDSLNESDKLDFENELKRNSKLRAQVNLEKEIQNAISEKDILILRKEISQIQNPEQKEEGSFELFEGFSNIEQLDLNLPPDELLDFYDSLPKAHIYQHSLVSGENIHEFYKEQELAESEADVSEDDLDDFDLPGLEEAVLEKDIMDLRSTLDKVSELVKLPFSSEEIDKYNSGELTGKEMEKFEKELTINGALRKEVQIYREVEKALGELDISKLRNRLSGLMETETSWNVNAEQIEEFIDGELDGNKLEEFKSEYEENTDLKAEVSLRKNINKAIGEKDIMSLSEQLGKVRKDSKTRDIKSILPDKDQNRFNWLRAGVAVAIILFAFSGLFRNDFVSLNETYDYYYESPEWSPQRSLTTDLNYFREANGFFAKGEYIEAIKLYDKAINETGENSVFHFYKAASLQNLERFREAIPEYSMVINNGDNIFIEEAEWNKSLCYIKLDNKKLAKKQLEAIIKRDGYYAVDAKAILRRLRYSIK